MSETDPQSDDMTAGAEGAGADETDESVTRHPDGEHVAGRPEGVDDSEIRPGEGEPGLEGIDALPAEGDGTA